MNPEAARHGPVHLAALPNPLRWQNRPETFRHNGIDTLEVTAGPKTDLFGDPQSGVLVANAPRLLAPLETDALLQAKVIVDFQSAFDAGVLVLWADASRWAKLCFELSPGGTPMIVSVVNCDVSDDSNAFPVAEPGIHLRIARIGTTFAFHTSPDAEHWTLIRYFSLGPVGAVSAGFSAQSPQGAMCRAWFTQIAYEERTLSDIRSGA